jgi:MFS family permease
VTTVSTTDLSTLTEPIPVLTQRPRWRDTLTSLTVYNYRLYFISQIFANTGGWMQRVAVDWLILELTGSVALVGLTVTLQFAPALLLAPWSGVLSDRANRRVVLIACQATGVVVNALLAALVLLGAAEAWHVFLAAGILGVSMSLDGPSRSAFISEMVGTHRLRNAISLNASVFHLGGLIGPAISGVLIGLIGSGWSIAINTGTSAIALSALLLMRQAELLPSPRAARSRGAIRRALSYAVGKPTILWPIVLLAFVATFGMNLPVLLAASANDVYGTGAAGYGLYSSLAAAGAFVGALLAARRRALRLRLIVFATLGYGVVTLFAGVAPWYPVFLAALVGLGVARLTFAISAESMTQLSTNLGIRGRVMSFYFMVIVGGQALGGVLMGWIAEHLGVTAAFVVAGGVPALAAITIAIVLGVRHQLRLTVNLRTPRRFIQIVPRTTAAA